jgi:hypothetical protein
MATSTTTKQIPETRMVRIRIPLDRDSEDQTVYVAVNGQSFMIKRGEYVEVPEYVAEVLQRKDEMLDRAYNSAADKKM